jgi:hypothetical protein
MSAGSTLPATPPWHPSMAPLHGTPPWYPTMAPHHGTDAVCQLTVRSPPRAAHAACDRTTRPRHTTACTAPHCSIAPLLRHTHLHSVADRADWLVRCPPGRSTLVDLETGRTLVHIDALAVSPPAPPIAPFAVGRPCYLADLTAAPHVHARHAFKLEHMRFAVQADGVSAPFRGAQQPVATLRAGAPWVRAWRCQAPACARVMCRQGGRAHLF